MGALQREIDEQEKLLTELKRKFNSINTLMTEIKQLKAVRQQMVNENQKTYAELKQEFEGVFCPFFPFCMWVAHTLMSALCVRIGRGAALSGRLL